jgi:hypothetical protein
MPTDKILALLIAECDKINRAIEALGAPTGKRRGRPLGSKNAHSTLTESTAAPAKTVRKRRHFSPAQREAARKRMKAYWAKKRKTAKKAA